MTEMYEFEISRVKQFRQSLDETLQSMKAGTKSRERSLAITKVQEAIMWLGMELKELNGGASCYKHGYDPTSTTVEPQPDGLGL